MGHPSPDDAELEAKLKPTSAKDLIDDAKIVSTQLGIWQFSTLKDSEWNPKIPILEITSTLTLFRRLTLEIYSLSPGLLILYVLSKIWSGIEFALLLHLSSRLLQIIEVGLREGQVDAYAIFIAMVTRLSCVVLVTLLQWWSDQALPGLKTSIVHHYEVYLMRARLRLDLAAAQEPDRLSKVTAEHGWHAFDAVFSFFSEILASSSQLYFIFHASRSSGGPLFAILCMAKPILNVMYSKNLWSKEWMIYANNPHYQRMNAFLKLSSDQYRQDYIAGNIANHILQEYEKASQNLGETCTDDWWEQFHKEPSPYFNMLAEIFGDLPMIYCAISAVVSPTKFSVASVAVLQHSSITLRYSIQDILHTTNSFQRHISNLKNLYGVSEVKMKLQEGDAPYPDPSSTESAGMAFELRNVSFSYPGAPKTTKALNDVSLSIKPGQLVVIVGANGSGKSTIIKLLSRFYDPSSGTLLIDGIPAERYLASDLRRATTSFTQDHKLYPLSLYENIGLGHPERLSDQESVTRAAEEGGASEFIGKLEDGLETVLEPNNNLSMINTPSDSQHPLQRKMQMIQKELDISGGERQRVIASRTFMHLHSGQVKFVAVDEPSSALDAEGEARLFDRLLKAREGKTMLFVTHRFAHLTKYADVIVCMKDGAIAELGTHEELMRLGGEYAKLYDIQANAFRADNMVLDPLGN